MKIYYGSIGHLLLIFTALAFSALMYFLLRNRKRQTKRLAILIIMLVNVAQHLGKSIFYPQYWGDGFTAISTAYNVCAFLILFSPLAIILDFGFLRTFFSCFGTAAGMVAMLVPYWHIGDSIFNWDVFRFFVCHALLFTSSILMLLLKIHTPSYKFIPFAGILFFSMIGIIILNDMLCIKLGLCPGLSPSDVGGGIRNINPCWSFGPPEQFAWLKSVAKVFVPNYFVDANPTGQPMPILWYLIPGYIIITLIAIPICILLDRKSFVQDFEKLREKAKKRKESTKKQ